MSDTLKAFMAKNSQRPTPNPQAPKNNNNMTLSKGLAAGGSLLSAFQTIGSAYAQNRSLKSQAEEEKAAAISEKGNYDIITKQAADQYLDAMSMVNVAAASSGVDVGSGSVLSAKKTLGQKLNDFNNITRENSIAAMHSRTARMWSLRAQASKTVSNGWLSAIAQTAQAVAGFKGL